MPNAYPNLSRIVQNNFVYLANLAALEAWYMDVRRSFFEGQEFGDLIYAGLLEKVKLAREERIKRLLAMAEKMPKQGVERRAQGKGLCRESGNSPSNVERACGLFSSRSDAAGGADHRERFLIGLRRAQEKQWGELHRGREEPACRPVRQGTLWLEAIIRELSAKVGAIFPSLDLYNK